MDITTIGRATSNSGEGEGNISMLAKAHRSDCTSLGMPENTEELVHPDPVPSAVHDMLEVGFLDLSNHAGCIGEIVFRGSGPEIKSIIQGEA